MQTLNTCQDIFSKTSYDTASDLIISSNIDEQNFQVVQKLGQGKFPVYLIHSDQYNQSFTMKVYPFKQGELNPRFVNEARFSCLSHPNINPMLALQPDSQSYYQGKYTNISFILSEYTPNKTFFEVFETFKITFDEKLARTYFHQLMSGVEYLHLNGVSHLDLKLENLLLGTDFTLKITDFDLSYKKSDKQICTTGTKFYRAPELINKKCTETENLDIYSAGIILFLFKTGGILPHLEEGLVYGVNLLKLLENDSQAFWDAHCKFQRKPCDFFDSDFKNLFQSMTALNPNKRATVQQIKASNWYNGPIYSDQEVCQILNQYYNKKSQI